MDIEPSDDVFCNARSGLYCDCLCSNYAIRVACWEVSHRQGEKCITVNRNRNFISKMIVMLIVLNGNGCRIMSSKILQMNNYVSRRQVKAIVKLL